MNSILRFALTVAAVMAGYAAGKQAAVLLQKAGVSIAVSGE